MKKIRIGVTFNFMDRENTMVTCREVEIPFYENNNELFRDTKGHFYGKVEYKNQLPVDHDYLRDYLKPAGIPKTLEDAERILYAHAKEYCAVGPYVAQITPLVSMIWSSDYSNLEDVMDKNRDEFDIDEDASYDEIADRARELNDEYFEDEVTNLSSIYSDYFVAIGEIVRWNGRGRAYKRLTSDTLGEAIRETMQSFGGDNHFEVFVRDDDVFVTQLGHDNPVSPSVIKIRTVKSELLDDDEFYYIEDLIDGATDKELDERTNKIGKEVLDVYGVDKERLADCLARV